MDLSNIKRIDLTSFGLPFCWKIPTSNKEATTSNASGFFMPSLLPMNMEQIASQFYNVTPIQKASELVFALSTHCARFTRCSILTVSGIKKPQLTLRLLFCLVA